MASPVLDSSQRRIYGTPDDGSKNQHLSADGSAQIIVRVPAVTGSGPLDGWANMVQLVEWAGGVEIYGAMVSSPVSAGGDTVFPLAPFQIDWQVFSGMSCPSSSGPMGGTFDDELQPTFQGSTVFKIADTSRSGLLCQVGGTAANTHLVRARVPGVLGIGPSTPGGAINVTLLFRFLPGLLGPTRVVQAGSFIG